MNNINPIDVIKNCINLLKLNRSLELQIDTNEGQVDDDEILIHHIWYFSFNGVYHIYDENNVIFDWDYLDDAIDFFENSNERDGLIITEILLHHEDDVTRNIELYLCEENDCYYQRSRSAASLIQRKFRSRNFRQSAKQGLLKNRALGEITLAPKKHFGPDFPGGSEYHNVMKEINERRPFSFGKTTYKFNSDIKYLESLNENTFI